MTGRDPLAALDALEKQRARRPRRSRPRATALREDGPFDRRITTNRRISLTGLLPPGADVLALRPTSSGLILTTDVVSGTPVEVRSICGRKEVWLRGRALRALLPPGLDPRAKGRAPRSIPLDVYRRHLPGGGCELELVRRGGGRSLG